MFFQLTNLLYKLLGPSLSTRLARSNIGKLFVRHVSGGTKIFTGKYGIKIKLPVQEASLLGFSYLGVVNPLETKLMEKVLKKADIFVDIGAYIDGWYSFLAAQLTGETGRVYAFEPVDKFYKQLSYNISLNKYINIVLEKAAVSAKTGKKFFYVGNKASSFYNKHAAGELDTTIHKTSVRTYSLDDYLAKHRIKTPAMVKIDVECAEMEVLQGMTKLLKQKDAPMLLIEVVDIHLRSAGTSETALVSFLAKFGYTPFTIHPNGTHLYVNQRGDRGTVNLFFAKGLGPLRF